MSRHAKSQVANKPRFDPLQNVKKGDAAYHAVRRSILLGHTQPGETFLEQRIAEQLNCSQGTVREVLLRLEQDGLVLRRGYRGTVVSTTSIQEAAQMVEIRIQIESTGARQSTMSIGRDILAELAAITNDMDEAVRNLDFYRCSELDRAFHMTLFHQAALPSLEPILNRCALHIHRFTYLNAEEMEPELSFGDNHRALLEVIQSRDPAAAAKSINSHIGHVIERWAPNLMEELNRIHKHESAPLR